MPRIDLASNDRVETPRCAVPARFWMLVACLFAILAAPLAAQEELPDSEIAAPESIDPGLGQVWLEARDRGGKTPQELAAADLRLLEAGAEAEIVALERSVPGAAQVVLFFDPTLASSATLRRGAEALGRLADGLTALGEVTVVVADPEPSALLTTRDPLELGERLNGLALNKEGHGELLAQHQRTIEELRGARRAGRSYAGSELVDVVRTVLEERTEIVRRELDGLLVWIAERPPAGGGQRLLFLVADGFDLDPIVSLAPELDEEGVRALSPLALEARQLETTVHDSAAAIAALGWTLVPVAIGAGPAAGALSPGAVDLRDPQAQGSSTSAGTGVGFTLKPGSLLRGRRQKDPDAPPEEAPAASFIEPLEPLRMLAETSGGEVVTADAGARDLLARLTRRLRLVYRPPAAAPSRSAALEVLSRRENLQVRASRLSPSRSPEPLAAARLRRLLAGEEVASALDVAAVLRLSGGGSATQSGELDTRVDLRDHEDLTAVTPSGRTLRVTTAAARSGQGSEIRSEVITGQDLEGLEEWRYRTSLVVAADAGQVAVIVEELASARWGGTVAAVVEGEVAASAADVLPSPKVIEIERPEDELLRGRVRFETRVFDPRVARVELLLDDRGVAKIERAPWSARVDLGRTPRRQNLTAVAYDAQGNELGRHSAVINGGSAGLGVDIVRPQDGRGVGWVEVEAQIAVPLERRLDRVIFYWNAEQVATLYAPPFRQRLYVPPDRSVGYVRVVALLDDGTLAEDAELLNGPAGSEQIDVELVELYVVVTGNDGRPVRGLSKEDFRVREDGNEQEVSTFSDAGDLPLTLGLAIDSSSSMFIKLPVVQRAAARFLRSTFSERDRAFLVDFDTQPRLARGTTGDLDRLVRSIENLEPSGRTALWESIVFSLVQLQGVGGRKALIVFSDGADEDDQFPFDTCLRLARKMGVPIYLILTKREPEKGDGLNLFSRPLSARIDRLVEAVGGRVFYAREYEDLDAVYAEIEQELRSQYLLAYYPKKREDRGAWREVDVEVLEKGLEPRTLQGYWP